MFYKLFIIHIRRRMCNRYNNRNRYIDRRGRRNRFKSRIEQ